MIRQTINRSIAITMCLKTVCTAPVGAGPLFHFKTAHALQYDTFIIGQWGGYGPLEEWVL